MTVSSSHLNEARRIDELSRGSILGMKFSRITSTRNVCVASQKLCFVSVLCDLFEIVYHGGRRGDTAQALAQWWHPVASSEALDVLHLLDSGKCEDCLQRS